MMKEFKTWIPVVGEQKELIGAIILNHNKVCESDTWFNAHPDIEKQRGEVKKLLTGVRFSEDGKEAHTSVSVRLESKDELIGSSWQLAIAICDKMVRLNPDVDYSIVATGTVNSSNLDVNEISDFSDKLEYLLTIKLKSPILFYPQKNHEKLSDIDKKNLKKLEKEGWKIQEIHNLEDVAWLWKNKSGIFSGNFNLIFILLLIMLIYLLH